VMKSLLFILLSCVLMGASSFSLSHTQTPPSVYFLRNSATPRTDSAWYQQNEQVKSIDDALTEMVHTLHENPQLVILAMGYCDYLEEDRGALSLARASKVREMLIDKGVPPDQVEVEGRGDQPRITKVQMANMTDPIERETAHAHNRYVNYTVVRFDRKP